MMSYMFEKNPKARNMKKKFMIISCTLFVLSLSAFSYVNLNKEQPPTLATLEFREAFPMPLLSLPDPVDLTISYDVGSRFTAVKRSDLLKANSIDDFIPYLKTRSIESYKSVQVIIVENERKTDRKQIGENKLLTEGQHHLFRTSALSTHFTAKADFLERNEETGEVQVGRISHYHTITPEQEAEYIDGKESLLRYFRENSEAQLDQVNKKKLRPAKIYFTLNKSGKVENVKVANHSGFPSLDILMIKLIKNIPGEWKVAKNEQGKLVDQDLSLSFGVGGC